MNSNKTVLILGANSDVAKQCILQYLKKGFSIIASSRNLESLENFKLALTRMWEAIDVQVDWSRPA